VAHCAKLAIFIDIPPADSNPTATTTKPTAPKKPAKPAAAPARQGAAQSTATPPVVQR